VQTGKVINDPPPRLLELTNPRGAAGPLLIQIEGSIIRLLRPPDAEELAVRQGLTRFDPQWQAAEAARYEQQQEGFAAAVPLRQPPGARPDDPDLLARRAGTQTGRKQWDAALADLARAREVAPWRTELVRALALVQASAGQAHACQRTCAHLLSSP